MKVSVYRSFFLTFICIVILLAMHRMPSYRIGNMTPRTVDILSELRPDEPELVADTLNPLFKESSQAVAFVDTCKSGMTCIEDYSDSTHYGMDAFYEALASLDSVPRAVRIAYFGDSYIEGDILTADFRTMLQSRFGGCGVGYVDIASTTNGFRPTVRHHYEGWDFHSITDSIGFDRSLQGLSNRYFRPYAGAYTEYRGISNKYPLLDTCQLATIYLHAVDTFTLVSTVNGRLSHTYQVSPKPVLQTFTENGQLGKVRWTVPQGSQSIFYGASLDGMYGISLDNFSMRGSSGLSLRSVPTSFVRQFNTLRPYDLIILQYGLNVATKRGINYDGYYTGMCNVIEQLKALFPHTSILIIGVGDRAYKTDNGEYRTMPGVRNLIKYQQRLAVESGVAFWNLYMAMGGEGSIQQLAEKGLANLDYTHINFKGGAHIAQLLYESIIYGYEQYLNRKTYADR